MQKRSKNTKLCYSSKNPTNVRVNKHFLEQQWVCLPVGVLSAISEAVNHKITISSLVLSESKTFIDFMKLICWQIVRFPLFSTEAGDFSSSENVVFFRQVCTTFIEMKRQCNDCKSGVSWEFFPDKIDFYQTPSRWHAASAYISMIYLSSGAAGGVSPS